MSRSVRFASICWVAILFHTPPLGAESGPWSYDPADSSCTSHVGCPQWVSFRKQHQAPYQAMALGQFESSEALVILSEPPPVLSKQQLDDFLIALFGDTLLEKRHYRWMTGVDGWLEDIVLRVRLDGKARTGVLSGTTMKSWEAPADVVDKLRILHQVLFRTTEGFWVDDLSTSPAQTPIEDIRVSASDLQHWFNTPGRTWTSATDGEKKYSSKQIFTDAPIGLYRSAGGLVALLLPPTGERLNASIADYRRFAVETDVLFGAIGLGKRGAVLLGRSRQVPLAVLPPLRFETLIAFANEPQPQLEQSYERQRFFAGRIVSGDHAGWDWAPILLSRQLQDGEMGTLLNLADQILKSWSEHGKVDYFAFGYPKPPSYPFGEDAASEYFAKKMGADSLIFNWNTGGLAVITTMDQLDFLTFDRTGALPILYLPGSSGEDQDSDDLFSDDSKERAEDARNYFASMQDPILIRVAQNVILFQAVQSFLAPVHPPAMTNSQPSRSEAVGRALEEKASSWLASQTKSGDPNLQALIVKIKTDYRLSDRDLARMLSSPREFEREWRPGGQPIQRLGNPAQDALTEL
ncbi:MAG: hypothetical protein K1X70_09665 [Leptospirales bacterium]|nr:hypothetical protein [Leptospirales bacterium]